MRYDFTSILDRTGKDAKAVELINIPNATIQEGFDRIPMWIADMSFPTVDTIVEELKARAMHPAYGYFLPTDEYFESIIGWHRGRKGVSDLKREYIGYENSVLGGMNTALKVLCSPGDNVLIHSPAYIGFTAAIENNGYHMVRSDLKLDESNIWRMDFEDMEQKIVEKKIHTAVFCSPHNPCGRVWEHDELEKMMNLFKKYNVYVISDEIWSDILLDHHHHIPLQSISEDAKSRVIALYAPSKTFNLAGLVGSYHIIYDDWLRGRVEKEASLSHYNMMNVLSMHALIGAYKREGCQWCDELCQVLTHNVDYACDFIQKHFHGVTLSKPEATYMLFLNCSGWCKAHGKSFDELLRAGVAVGVIWQDGRRFFGENCIRINLALPFSRMQEALQRLDQYVFNETAANKGGLL